MRHLFTVSAATGLESISPTVVTPVDLTKITQLMHF